MQVLANFFTFYMQNKKAAFKSSFLIVIYISLINELVHLGG